MRLDILFAEVKGPGGVVFRELPKERNGGGEMFSWVDGRSWPGPLVMDALLCSLLRLQPPMELPDLTRAPPRALLMGRVWAGREAQVTRGSGLGLSSSALLLLLPHSSALQDSNCHHGCWEQEQSPWRDMNATWALLAHLQNASKSFQGKGR